MQGEVRLTVTDPLFDKQRGCTVYLIHGSHPHYTVDIRRRFNDFFYFRQSVKKCWPATYVPPVPEKKLTGNKEDQCVEVRRKHFQLFLSKTTAFPHLVRTPALQEFLRNPGIEIQKYCSTVPKQSYQDMLFKYREAFKQHFKEGEVTASEDALNVRKIEQFTIYVRRAGMELRSIRGTLQELSEARKGFNARLEQCFGPILQDYDNSVFREYSGGIPLITHSGAISNVTEKGNPFAMWLDMVRYEGLEIEAMGETLDERISLIKEQQKKEEELLVNQAELSKLRGGRTTLKSFFAKGSKNEQIMMLQKKIPQQEKEKAQLKQFIMAVNLVISAVFIPQFITEKAKQYYAYVGRAAGEQVSYLNKYGEYLREMIDSLRGQQ